MYNTQDIKNAFVEQYKNKDFVIDKTGAKLIELIAATFIADTDHIIRKPNLDYVKRELSWYESQSLFVEDIPGKTPLIWKQVADKNGKINSNYGYLIFSDENYNQYENVKNELINNKFSRRALMIYQRPSMHIDYNKDGMSDFICTTSNQFFIRNDSLISVYNIRSNDAVFGYNNDFYWAQYVHKKLYYDLIEKYPKLKLGDLIWNAGSIHIYERHFKYLDDLL